jgi:hypothetical protein
VYDLNQYNIESSLSSFHLTNQIILFYKLNQAEKKLMKEELNACSIPITTDGEFCDLFEVQREIRILKINNYF